MIDSLIIKGIALCLVAGFVIYMLILACSELMTGIMRDDDDEAEK